MEFISYTDWEFILWNKTCATVKDVIKEKLLHYHVGKQLMISHLLVLLNFFSHFLLYSHSCQWSVGTVKHVQSPSAFTISPAGCKMPVLISKKPVGLKMVRLQSIPCKHLTLTQHFLVLLQAAWAKISKHPKLWLDLHTTDVFIVGVIGVTGKSNNVQKTFIKSIFSGAIK